MWVFASCVAALAGSPTHAPIVQGLGLLRSGDVAGGFHVLNDANVSLGTYGDHFLVQHYASHGGCTAAAAVAEALPTTSAFHGSAWTQVAECWLARHEAAAAADAVESLAPYARGARREAYIHYLRGRVAQQQGEVGQAQAHFRETVLFYPETHAASLAQAQLRSYVVPTPVEWLQRGDAERERNRNRDARRCYTTAQALARGKRNLEGVAQGAELGLIELDITGKSYSRAMTRLESLTRARDPDVRARALFLKGDVYGRQGRLAPALATYQQLLSEMPEHPFAAEAALAGAHRAHHAGKTAAAEAFLHWLTTSPVQHAAVAFVGDDGVYLRQAERSSPQDRARWLEAWLLYRKGAAAAELESALAEDGELDPSARYWLARAYHRDGNTTAAQAQLESLVASAPLSYYGLMASDRAGTAGFKPPTGAATLADITNGGDFQTAVWLAQNGLPRQALQVVNAVPFAELDATGRLVCAWLYARLGEQQKAFITVRRASQAEGGEILNELALFQLGYPRRYPALIEANADRYGVPEALLFAIMREESAFDPKAVSPRKARGLMQMLPSTAARLARSAKLKRFRTHQLHQPAVSIQLGALYVATLLDKFDGNIIAAIASYQAGESNVARWLKKYGGLPTDEFVEEIPFASTRQYVKKVMRTYTIYRMLYEQEVLPEAGGALFDERAAP